MIELLRAIWQADSGFPSGSLPISGGLEASGAVTAADPTALPPLLYDMLTLHSAGGDRVTPWHAHRAPGAFKPTARSRRVQPARARGAIHAPGNRQTPPEKVRG
jgi:hypothetical protein